MKHRYLRLALILGLVSLSACTDYSELRDQYTSVEELDEALEPSSEQISDG